MAFRTWQVSKIKYCEHVGREIALEADMVFPHEVLPDQPPRALARPCSNAMTFNQFEKPASLVWDES